MTRILIVYASREGQTAKIAHEIAGGFRFQGQPVDIYRCIDCPEGLRPASYDLVFAGSSVHEGVHDPGLGAWVRANLEELSRTKSAFFSVSLSAAGSRPEQQQDAQRLVAQFIEQTGWDPDTVASFGGAIAYSKYGFIKRRIMRSISAKEGGDVDTSHDYEYTDWESVCEFAQNAADMAAPAPAMSRPSL